MVCMRRHALVEVLSFETRDDILHCAEVQAQSGRACDSGKVVLTFPELINDLMTESLQCGVNFSIRKIT